MSSSISVLTRRQVSSSHITFDIGETHEQHEIHPDDLNVAFAVCSTPFIPELYRRIMEVKIY